MHAQLVNYFVHIPPLADPFSTLYTFCYLCLCNYLSMLIYFLKLPPYLRQCARTSGEIFGTRTSGDLICAGKCFYGLFCTHITPFWPIFYTYHLFKTYFVHYWLIWSILYIYFLVVLFYGAVHLRLVTYSVHIPPLVDLFSTQGCLWKHILYTYVFIFCLFCTSTTCSWLCTLLNLGPSLVSLSVRIHHAGWLILYIRNFSTAYSVHIPPHVGLNFLRTTSSCAYLWRAILYNYLLLVTYSVQKELFMAKFVHTLPVGDLFCT